MATYELSREEFCTFLSYVGDHPLNFSEGFFSGIRGSFVLKSEVSRTYDETVWTHHNSSGLECKVTQNMVTNIFTYTVTLNEKSIEAKYLEIARKNLPYMHWRDYRDLGDPQKFEICQIIDRDVVKIRTSQAKSKDNSFLCFYHTDEYEEEDLVLEE